MYITNYKLNGMSVCGIVDFFVNGDFSRDYYREGDRYISVCHDLDWDWDMWSEPATVSEYREALHTFYLAWSALFLALMVMADREAIDSAIEAEYYPAAALAHQFIMDGEEYYA